MCCTEQRSPVACQLAAWSAVGIACSPESEREREKREREKRERERERGGVYACDIIL